MAKKSNFFVPLSEEDSVKQSRFTDSQILVILKKAKAGSPVPSYAGSRESVRPRATSGAANLAARMRR
jgi:hypothetical protein